jgi:hypothetical protein
MENEWAVYGDKKGAIGIGRVVSTVEINKETTMVYVLDHEGGTSTYEFLEKDLKRYSKPIMAAEELARTGPFSDKKWCLQILLQDFPSLGRDFLN